MTHSSHGHALSSTSHARNVFLATSVPITWYVEERMEKLGSRVTNFLLLLSSFYYDLSCSIKDEYFVHQQCSLPFCYLPNATQSDCVTQCNATVLRKWNTNVVSSGYCQVWSFSCVRLPIWQIIRWGMEGTGLALMCCVGPVAHVPLLHCCFFSVYSVVIFLWYVYPPYHSHSLIFILSLRAELSLYITHKPSFLSHFKWPFVFTSIPIRSWFLISYNVYLFDHH